MNRYISYENRIYEKIKRLMDKYNCSIQFVDKLSANACVIKFDEKYLIFVSNMLDKKILPLSLLHEIGHIHYKTIRDNPKKYNYFIELLSNLYAINRLMFSFPFVKRVKLLILAFYKETNLYNYYVNNTKIGGNIIYGKISKNK